ncbi:MAG: PIG-L family deacetylase [Calditrichaeota bacterium]|nr:MAG: PIG-L family deacetylase [Calditrichota bacterium]
MNKDAVLICAPHTDDGELGCGGTIRRFVEEGKTVYYVAFTTAGTEPPFTPELVKSELRAAMDVLGIPSHQLILYNYEIRKLGYVRQQILDQMINLKKEIDPGIVFLPSNNDIHQDHLTIYQEGVRAFKQTTILAYELPWNNITFHTRHFVPLQKNHIEKKLEALSCYKSQKHRNFIDADFIWGLARSRGVQIAQKYAEAFDVIRWILV